MVTQSPAVEVTARGADLGASPIESGSVEGGSAGRPVALLPVLQLVRLSAYWLGLTCVFGGLTPVLAGRIKYEAGLVGPGQAGEALAMVTAWGAVLAMVVQPTIGTISDYTVSRWGRRKPYIFAGSVLDLVFLFGVATSNTLLAIAAFVVLLQVSSNIAQGPFQGYVPDLVPEPQVGLASALMGLFMAFGNVTGYAIAALAVATNQFFLATMALGAVEFVTMLSVVIHVDEGRAPKPREGRSWGRIALEAWGTDILREHSFLFLLGSRLFVLMAGSIVMNLAVFYLADTLGLNQKATGETQLVVLAIAAVGNMAAIIPAARLSDRIGRKPVIYGSCALGAIGVAILAIASSTLFVYVGAAFFGVSGGTFLAVDWALMTDIIPKASSGRYMGISNVATASATILATIVGGALIMDTVNGLLGLGMGARAAMAFGVLCYLIGAALLVPVVEGRQHDHRPSAQPASLTA